MKIQHLLLTVLFGLVMLTACSGRPAMTIDAVPTFPGATSPLAYRLMRHDNLALS